MAKSSENERISKQQKKGSYIQGKPHKDIIGFYSRNFEGQKEAV